MVQFLSPAVLLDATAGYTFTIEPQHIYGVLGAALVTLLGFGFRRIKPHLLNHFYATRRLRRVEGALTEKGVGLWLAPTIPIEPPADYERAVKKSIPIIVVANLKGGVGKTTTVANLVGHYGLKKNLRVLAIDLDFQGSLSEVLVTDADSDQAHAQQKDGSPSKAAQLISGKDAAWLLGTTEPVAKVDKARCVPAYYTLSSAENRIMIEWLIGKREDDIRYNLARVLHDPQVQDRFDIILIDAPPRLTTACVQGLCAATHVLIPTVLDGLSAEASAGLVGQLSSNEKLWPQLKLLGAFGNLTNSLTYDPETRDADGRLADFEADALIAASDAINLALEQANPTLRAAQSSPLFPTDCFIPDKAELSRKAGDRIGYSISGGSMSTQQLSRAYDRLGDEIDRRVLASVKV
jgi:cellulose biosynthesis protein BcsQ